MAALSDDIKDAMVTFRTSAGMDTRGSLLRLTPSEAAFELYSPDCVLKSSEVLDEFTVFAEDNAVYKGRAVVRESMSTGTVLICSAFLDNQYFDNEFFTGFARQGQLSTVLGRFMRRWQKVCQVRPDFKVAVADIQTFLIDLRHWVEQVELGIRSSPVSNRVQQERAIIDEIAPQVLPVLDELFGRFETAAAQLAPEEQAVHRAYIQRHLHPIVLCAPFAYRSYRKPLGYAGDYEVVNMMLRDPQQGGSLFAKLFNVWLLHQGTAEAHRNRIHLLKEKLIKHVAAAARQGRTARILNLGCGPAWEIQEFLQESLLSNSAHFTLMDFNDETLEHASQALRQKQHVHHRTATVEFIKKSVQQLLKDALRGETLSRNGKFDLVYCAGLFDYLPDRTCKCLTVLLHQSVGPGGCVMTTNVSPASPNRGSLELILDWHLMYRDVNRVLALRPDTLPEDAVRVTSDITGFNIFMEAQRES